MRSMLDDFVGDATVGSVPERLQPKLPEDMDPVRVGTPQEAEALQPGRRFIEPNGNVLQRPYDDFQSAREGSRFYYQDPETRQRRTGTKPVSEPLDVGPRILYGMAGDDSQRKQVLSKMYPGAEVGKAGEGYLVHMPDGKWLNPEKGGMGPFLGTAAGQAAPGALSAAGGLVGGVGMMALSKNPWLAWMESEVGAGLGMTAGRAFNNMVLGMAGVTSSDAEEKAMLDEAAVAGMLGEGVGRVAGRVGGALVGAGKGLATAAESSSKASEVLPAFLRYMTGTDPEKLLMAQNIRQTTGAIAPPGSFAHEVPMLKLIANELDRMFRLTPIQVSAKRYYERASTAIGDRLGLGSRGEGGTFLEPKTGIEYHRTGTELQLQVAKDLAEKNDALAAAHQARVADMNAAGRGQRAESQELIYNLQRASEQTRAVLTRATQASLDQIKRVGEASLKAMGGGPYPGRDVGPHLTVLSQITKVLSALQKRSSEVYNSVYSIAGNTPLFKTPLEKEAMAFLEEQGPGFESEVVGAPLAQRMKSISQPRAVGIDPDTGEAIMAVPDFTLQQAHSMRKWARSRTDPSDPSFSVISGAKKHMAGMLDRWLHDPQQPPNIQLAVKELDRWDEWYGDAISKFNQEAIVQLRKAEGTHRLLSSPDVAELVFNSGSDFNLSQVKKIIGGDNFRNLLNIDVNRVVKRHTDSTGRVDATTLANEVATRIESGIWPRNDMTAGTLETAHRIGMLEGTIKLDALPDDEVGALLKRAVQQEAQAKELAKTNPMEALDKAVKAETAEFEKRQAAEYEEAQKGPLGRLLAGGLPGKNTTMAADAAEKIVANPNLIREAAERFGPDSHQFNLIRQNYVESVLREGNVNNVTRLDADVQDILLPGVTKDELLTIARNWDFLSEGSPRTFGGSLAATSRVTNPLAELRKMGFHKWTNVLSMVPGGNYVGRFMLGKYYAFVTDSIATNPKIWSYMARGLEDPRVVEREKARLLYDKMMEPIKGLDKVGEFLAAARAKGRQRALVGGAVGAGAAGFEQGRPSGERQDRRRHYQPPPSRAGDETLRSLPR